MGTTITINAAIGASNAAIAVSNANNVSSSAEICLLCLVSLFFISLYVYYK